MRKLIFILFFSIAFLSYGQEKYALVIGNSNYTNFGILRNSVNDANDMGDALTSLGFTVDIVLDGNLNQMENAAIRLRNRLSEAGNNAFGFFYYAGHGLEMGGVNYLIPADANIPDRNFLRERAFSVQVMLDMLNDSRNSLNIVVLDACRDFPAAWSRSLNRGLAIISNPPANHIIMYATGAGQVASDGVGRNGLFTSHLLNNLRQPNDVNEIFRRTMVDVANASNNEQRPALYTDFGRNVFFGSQLVQQPRPETAILTPETTLPEFGSASGMDNNMEFPLFRLEKFFWFSFRLYFNNELTGYFDPAVKNVVMQFEDTSQLYSSARKKYITSFALLCSSLVPLLYIINFELASNNMPLYIAGLAAGAAGGSIGTVLFFSSIRDFRSAIELYNSHFTAGGMQQR